MYNEEEKEDEETRTGEESKRRQDLTSDEVERRNTVRTKRRVSIIYGEKQRNSKETDLSQET